MNRSRSIIVDVNKLQAVMQEWRRDIHQHPELAFNENRTAEMVAHNLESFGAEVFTGIGKTGVVGKLTNGNSDNAIGLRADMDALPMQENNDFSYRSINEGVFHGCGHDGHTAMLLGAAKYLSLTKEFEGTVYFIFQPAEEAAGGAPEMIKDGLFDKFRMTSVYGMHNMPGMPVGQFGIRSGHMFAAFAPFDIEITGIGGHAAMPQNCVDPIVISSSVIQALQTVVSRNIDPFKLSVISVTQVHAGDAYNVIPDKVKLCGGVRYFDQESGLIIKRRIEEILQGICSTYGASFTLNYDELYPVLSNHEKETDIAVTAASDLVGAEKVNAEIPATAGSEDFAFMLQEKPGAYILIGNGDGEGGCMIHHSSYDFNDRILPLGASYWIQLTENILT
jgi:hippurate hydrolase